MKFTRQQKGEQPLKYVRPRQIHGRKLSADPDVEDAQTALYALYQTDLYIPEPVVDGRIPKNAFGNLDVYVPSMVPPGAVHIRALDAKHAAKLLNIDYADAVTGFHFKGRHGTAVIEGIVIASEYRAAVDTVLESMVSAKADALEASRSAESLRLWKRFLVGIRVVQRVRSYRRDEEGNEEDQIADERLQKELAQEMAAYAEKSDGGGGFVDAPEADDRIARMAQRHIPDNDDPEDDDYHDDDYHDGGGGFVPEDESDGEAEKYEHEAEDQRVGAPALVREPSLFGLENFDIPVAVPLSEDDHQLDNGRSSFTVDEDDKDAPLSASTRIESSAGSALPPKVGLASSPAVLKTSLSIVKDVPSDFHEATLIDIVMDEKGVPTSKHISQAAMPPLHPTASPVLATKEVKNIITSEAETAIAARADPPQASPTSSFRSSEFDDDLLLEDPDDEDAEPEWLL